MTVRKADRPIVEAILKSLDDHPKAVERAMFLLGRRQTQEELSQEATLTHNNLGFSTVHARFGAYCYKILSNGGHLRGNTLATARHIAKKYANTQLLALAKERMAKTGAE